MLMQHPDTPYHVDFGADAKLTMGQSKKRKELMGKWSKGFPDVTIFGSKGAILLELKAGKVPNTEHTRRQRAFHQILRGKGYIVDFICSYDEAVEFIENNI